MGIVTYPHYVPTSLSWHARVIIRNVSLTGAGGWKDRAVSSSRATGEGAAWTWSDAWVLAAIMVQGRDDVELTDVVAAADAINHAILTENEVESAVRRLGGAGLIETRDRRFRLTEAGRDMAARRRGGMLSQVDDLLRRLRRLPVREAAWQLRPGELDAAARAWQQRAAQFINGRRRRPGQPL
jgi:hypothetical protein